mgnify:CR=1 FL=1
MSKRKAKEDDEAKGFKKTTPMHLKSLHERDQAKRLIVILEGAALETIKVKATFLRLFCNTGTNTCITMLVLAFIILLCI